MCLHRSMRATFAAAALLCAASLPVPAINEMFAKDGPLAKMDDADFKLASEALRRALDDGQDGQAHEWKNERTSASGSVTPLSTFEKDGMRCRGAKFAFSTQGVTSSSAWDLCLTKDGWKFWKAR